MRRLSSYLNAHCPIERDSRKSYEFSAQKSCFTKRTAISDESGSLHHHSVDYWDSEKRLRSRHGGAGSSLDQRNRATLLELQKSVD